MKRSASTTSTKAPATKPWHVYLVRCSDGSIYTGITPDVEARIRKHNGGTGAKYTASRGPVTLMYQERHSNRGEAMRREAEIKCWPKARKEKLASLKKGALSAKPADKVRPQSCSLRQLPPT